MGDRGLDRVRKLGDALLVGVFLLICGLPIALLGSNGDPVLLSENRLRASWPGWSWNRTELAKFPARFERYFNDQFGLRDELVRAHNAVKLRWLKVSPTRDVLLGRHRWLYYIGDHSLRDIRREEPLDIGQLEAWRRTLEERRDWLAARGIAYVVTMAPNKHGIYPENLPAQLRPPARASRYEQLRDYLRAHSDVLFVDLQGPLRDAKRRERVYHATDSHWNERGAFVAYQQLLRALQPRFPELVPWPRSSFAPRVRENPETDLVRMLNMGGLLSEPDMVLLPLRPRRSRPADPGFDPATIAACLPHQRPVATECSAAGPIRAVMFRDSFATSMIPFLSEHFRRILYIWHRPFDVEVIERERPDVVIEEWTERVLWYPPPPSLIPRVAHGQARPALAERPSGAAVDR